MLSIGNSLHEELQNFVDAGLSPYEAIKAGTSGAAEFLRQSSEFGRVAVGLRADLLLLDANPLEHVRNVNRTEWRDASRAVAAGAKIGSSDWRRKYCPHVSSR